MAQIKRFGVLQTAKFAAVMYFVISVIFMIPFGLIVFIGGSSAPGREGTMRAPFSSIFMLFMPIIYAIMGFIFVTIACLLYNIIAKYVGGIEIEIE